MFKPFLTALCVSASCTLLAQWPQNLVPNPGQSNPQVSSLGQPQPVILEQRQPSLSLSQGLNPLQVAGNIHMNAHNIAPPKPPPNDPYQLHLSTVYGHSNHHHKAISYRLPSKRNVPGAFAYRKALDKFRPMLEVKGSIKEAVFTVENAFFNGHLNREAFESDIDSMVNLVWVLAEASNQKPNHVHVQALFGDTVTVGETEILPLKYDFLDPWGQDDFRNQMVFKLLLSGSGQCHSLPLLYLILAEELGLQARIALSPGHSYIRFQGQDGKWNNFETTNGHQGSESWIMASGWVKAEALRNGLYLDTLSHRETMVQCMMDLVQGYTVKYGYDEFVQQAADMALEAAPGHLNALLMRCNYYATLTLYILEQMGYPSPQTFQRLCPLGFQVAEKAREFNQEIEDLGFVEVSREDYAKWLKSAEGGAK